MFAVTVLRLTPEEDSIVALQLHHHHRRRPTTSNLRSELLRERYLLKDAQGRVVETPRQMLQRVATAVAEAGATYGATPSTVRDVSRRFLRLMTRGLFLPNSPTLMNAGRPNGLLSACFVLGIDDSIDGIFEAIKRTALIQKAGGGTGFALDSLRPTGDRILSSGGVTSGPISFWRVIAEATHAIQQGAHRRGANMGMMDIEHPDILKFITAKQDLAAFANFNVSVKIGDGFMADLRAQPDKPHVVINPRDGQEYLLPRSLDIGKYGLKDLIAGDRTDRPCYTVQDVWDMVITAAHATGEPGICFIDRVNRDNPTPALGPITSTNPCGEQPLLAEEACNLGSINVSKFVLPDGTDIDWKTLGKTVWWVLRFLDNVVDVGHYPVPQITEVTLGNRKIGLGVMGLADTFILLGLRYDSEQAVRFAHKLSSFIQRTAHAASQKLAGGRGSFPNWTDSIWDTKHHRPMRNACCTTIAPTGSLSILGRCSAGIEPVYLLAYRRRCLDGRQFVQVHPLIERIGRRDGWLSAPVRQALLEGVPATEIAGIPRPLAEMLITSQNVSPDWHVHMQAAFQENVDNAVSKTVNLPTDATVSDVGNVFRLAFELGCKGITVYRDGSRTGQTFSAVNDGSSTANPTISPRARSRVTTGKTAKFRMGCGTLFVTVNHDKRGLCEVFANLGKAGGCPSQSEATCRAISVALRSGVDPRELVEQLGNIRCLSAARARKNGGEVNVLSCPDAIARAIEEAMGGSSDSGPITVDRHCPDCGQLLHRESGCFACRHCGYNNCG